MSRCPEYAKTRDNESTMINEVKVEKKNKASVLKYLSIRYPDMNQDRMFDQFWEEIMLDKPSDRISRHVIL